MTRELAIEILTQMEKEIYEKAYKEGYYQGWNDGNFVGKNECIPSNEQMPKEDSDVLDF